MSTENTRDPHQIVDGHHELDKKYNSSNEEDQHQDCEVGNRMERRPGIRDSHVNQYERSISTNRAQHGGSINNGDKDSSSTRPSSVFRRPKARKVKFVAHRIKEQRRIVGENRFPKSIEGDDDSHYYQSSGLPFHGLSMHPRVDT
ncbi:hypothetical protein VNO77_44253 [Canavalia gladiata]|uniref:Uncharacterized protein n=1 Tax=Canavalia gladiata TaxID=3824 RepID=A0AAN9JZC4_CANGL